MMVKVGLARQGLSPELPDILEGHLAASDASDVLCSRAATLGEMVVAGKLCFERSIAS
jgi:hypothetical protein